MPHNFKPGQRIRLIDSPMDDMPLGSEFIVIEQDSYCSKESVCFNFQGSVTWRPADYFELVPTGPVVTETVTKTRIVPGTYDGVQVYEDTSEGGWVVEIEPIRVDGDTADRLAAVLSALTKGLRDA